MYSLLLVFGQGVVLTVMFVFLCVRVYSATAPAVLLKYLTEVRGNCSPCVCMIIMAHNTVACFPAAKSSTECCEHL